MILRAVFGVRDEERFKRASTLVGEFARRADLITQLPLLRRNLGRFSPWARFQRARAALDEFIYEEIAARRAEVSGAEHDDVLSLLLSAKHDDGSPMSDEELRDELVTVRRRGARDHRHGARLGAGAGASHAAGPGPPADVDRGGRGRVPGRDDQGDAARAAGDRGRCPQADGARDDRRLRAAGGHLRPARRSPRSTTARTSIRTRRSSAPSASSTGRSTTTAGFPSAAACAAASARPSPSTRCAWCSGRSSSGPS